MRLLLSGGGTPEQVKELDKLFANYVSSGKVLYIPIAMEKRTYEECFEWFKSVYVKYGITDIGMCIDLNDCKDLNNYAAVFIGGGNTFKLLKEIKDSSFDKKLMEYLKNDGFVYGGSAGAIIFGKSIDTAYYADENNVNLTDLSGLNLLNDHKIWCHYNETKDLSKISKIEGKVIALYEESGLFFDGTKFNVIGKTYVEINSINN